MSSSVPLVRYGIFFANALVFIWVITGINRRGAATCIYQGGQSFSFTVVLIWRGGGKGMPDIVRWPYCFEI
jgi:hypothetical protein